MNNYADIYVVRQNVPVQSGKSGLLGKVAHVLSTRKYISNKEIEDIAMQKYRRGGHGITFDNIRKEFSVDKGEAQRTLKYFHAKEVLFTANDLISEGIIILKNKSPQEYFPTCIKAEIIEALTKQKSVQVKPTGATHSSVLTFSDS